MDGVDGADDIAEPDRWLSVAELSGDAADRLARPRVLLTSLYHPEWFPLPRFALVISDLARAAGLILMGQVHLIDMQLGASLDEITRWVHDQQPDIVGISATFGQHDLMNDLLDRLDQMPIPPLVLAGGSLTVRNEAMLLQRYPQLLIARGAGEPTIADVMAYFHGARDLASIRGIGYRAAPRGGAIANGRRPRHTGLRRTGFRMTAPGPEVTPTGCPGCWPRLGRSPIGIRRSREPCTWSTRSSSAAARTPSRGHSMSRAGSAMRGSSGSRPAGSTRSSARTAIAPGTSSGHRCSAACTPTATHTFPARTDLLLRPPPTLTVEQIADGVTDPDFVAEHATVHPFYTEVSYLLVSMECLIGAPYTRAVQARGLAGHADPTMGRVEARFAGWRIGPTSLGARCWPPQS